MDFTEGPFGLEEVVVTPTSWTQKIELNPGRRLELVHWAHSEDPQVKILALPGLGSSSRLFHWALNFLPSDTQLSVLHPYGVGGSSAVQADLELDDLVQTLAASYFQGQNQTPWHFWGISFGGFIAQKLAAVTKPAGLSLFCTTSAQAEFQGLNAIQDQVFEAAYRLSLEKRTRSSAELSVHPDTLQDQERFEKIVQWRQEPDVPLETVLWQNREARKFLSSDFRFDELPSGFPVLAMGGEDDRLVPPQNTKCFQEIRPETKWTLVERADHLFFMEHPQAVAERFFEFIKSKS